MYLFNNIETEIISNIREAKNNLKIAVTWFTNHEIFNEILEKLKNPEFKVSLIVLNDRINNKKEGLNFQKFINLNGDFYYSNNDNMVHHKFCIIDDLKLITGSYNWTYYAENRNWENVVLIDNSDIVAGYINEFNKIILNHSKVENIESVKQIISESSNEYLSIDYTLQAKKEEMKGNDLVVAKIYTELIRLNTKKEKKETIIKARNEIEQRYNNELLEVSPFEIGILFKNGYSQVIPAFEKLPFTVVKNGITTVDNAKSINVTIQKNDYYIPKTILTFDFKNLQPKPMGTAKIAHKLTLDKNGILTVDCLELNGYGRKMIQKINIKDWL